MEINEFKALMVGLSKGLGRFNKKDFTDDETVRVWYPSFKDMSLETFRAGCRLAIDTLDDFPSPRQLKELCTGNIRTDEQVGQDVAARIEHALRSARGGRTGWEWVKGHIGEVGCEVVQRCGGWHTICDIESDDEMPSKRKQWRDIATQIWQQHRAFGADSPIALPQKNSSMTAMYLKRAEDEAHGQNRRNFPADSREIDPAGEGRPA